MPAIEIRTPYDGKQAAASDASAVSFEVLKDSKGVVLNPGVLSKTVQSEKDSTDINLIIKNAEKNGGLIMSPAGTPIFGDFSNLPNWMQMKNTVAQAERSFALLPVDIRNKFNNNVKELVDFIADPKNDKEAVALKLKPYDVLLTALDLDGKTRITADERESVDKLSAAEKAARLARLQGVPPPSPGA